MLKVVGGPVLLFFGFVAGLIASSVMRPWRACAVVLAVLLSPIVVLIILQYSKVLAPDTVSTLSMLLPRTIELPLLGILVGRGLHTPLTVGQASGSSWGRGH